MKAQIQEEKGGSGPRSLVTPPRVLESLGVHFLEEGGSGAETPSPWKACLSCACLPRQASWCEDSFGVLGGHPMPPCPGLSGISQKIMVT